MAKEAPKGKEPDAPGSGWFVTKAGEVIPAKIVGGKYVDFDSKVHACATHIREDAEAAAKARRGE